jgi:hypothetical protein
MAPNTIAPPLCQGNTGALLEALELAVIVNSEVPVPLLARVTEGKLRLAVTLEAVPLLEVTAVASVTVPA